MFNFISSATWTYTCPVTIGNDWEGMAEIHRQGSNGFTVAVYDKTYTTWLLEPIELPDLGSDAPSDVIIDYATRILKTEGFRELK